MQAELTPRQREILGRVVEEYVATGQPIGSKLLVERSQLSVSSSTVRYELAELEGMGFLTHPHTSAGRIPTDRGYRLYVDALLERLEPRPVRFQLDLSAVRSEVESALQATTEALAELTSLLALVSAPPLETTTVRHVEVLLLQPQVVVVVVITSTGDVSKRVVTFDEPVDQGLASWAAEYLNERVSGLGLGTHLLRRRFEDPGLSAREREFLAQLQPAFTELLRAEQRLYVGGAASLLEDEALDAKRPFVRVGGELDHPKLRDVALVAACYGLSNRALGTVGLLGPVRMDYDKAIRSVRSAAHELSRFVEAVYAEN
jgi:heat-inducible transcriptional repressor